MGSPVPPLKVEFQNGFKLQPEVEEICRICGKSNEVLIDVFSSAAEKSKILYKLKFCFTPEVREN